MLCESLCMMANLRGIASVNLWKIYKSAERCLAGYIDN